jgi:hypothetical protein
MNPDPKAPLDKATPDELWQMLTVPGGDAADLARIREKLTRHAQADTQRKLDALSRQMQTLAQTAQPSTLATPTFWLALLAAVFSSFAVPWDTVGQTLERWQERASKTAQTSLRPQRLPSTDTPPAGYRPTPEPALPTQPSSAPLPASPLFPQ